jgi:hypothetical protein
MARGDDDIEKLLREVDGTLGRSQPGASGGRPGQPGPGSPAGAVVPGQHGGVVARLRAGVPRAVTAGAACGVVVAGVFSVVPFFHAISGGLGAFAAAAAVSLGGRLRRPR